MRIGLNPYQTTAPTHFGWSLWLPFRIHQAAPTPRRGRHTPDEDQCVNGVRLEEVHGEVAQEKLFIGTARMHLFKGVIQGLNEISVALFDGDADALPKEP